jgi:hypothetical protein
MLRDVSTAARGSIASVWPSKNSNMGPTFAMSHAVGSAWLK